MNDLKTDKSFIYRAWCTKCNAHFTVLAMYTGQTSNCIYCANILDITSAEIIYKTPSTQRIIPFSN